MRWNHKLSFINQSGARSHSNRSMSSSAPRDARVGVDAASADLRAENERLRARVHELESALSAAGIGVGGARESSSAAPAPTSAHRSGPCLPLAPASQPILVAPSSAVIAENGTDSLPNGGAAMHAEAASQIADSGATESEHAEQYRFGHVSAAPSLDAAAIRRYSRQMILPCVGAVAQVSISMHWQ
jgi:hypothetical protein